MKTITYLCSQISLTTHTTMKINDNKIMERMFRFAVMALAAVAISLVSVSCGGDDEESYDDGAFETGVGNSAAYQQAVDGERHARQFHMACIQRERDCIREVLYKHGAKCVQDGRDVGVLQPILRPSAFQLQHENI